MKNFPLCPQIRAFVLDMDGVLTDGTVITFAQEDPVRVMQIKDGYALQLAVRCGYKVAIISGGKSEGARKRLEGLGIEHIYMSTRDKLPVLKTFLQEAGLTPEEVLYMGDDMPDIPVMEYVGLSAAPADAAEDVLKIAQWISPLGGGKGAVRQVIESVLKQQGKWYTIEAFLW